MFSDQAQGRRCLLFNTFVLIIWCSFCATPRLINGQPPTTEENAAIIGEKFSLSCSTPSEDLWWSKDGTNITSESKRYKLHVDVIDPYDNTNMGMFQHSLTIERVVANDTGNYTCHSTDHPDGRQTVYLQAIIPPRITAHSDSVVRQLISKSVQFYCQFGGYPMDELKQHIQWQKKDDLALAFAERKALKQLNQLNATHVNATLDLENVFKKDNGTYGCSLVSPHTGNLVECEFSLLVLDVPQISIDYIKAVGASKIFLNWTLIDGNDPVQQYFVQYMKEGQHGFTYYNSAIDVRNTSYVLENFEPSSKYHIKISAKNSIGTASGYLYPQAIETLDVDPEFIPKIEAKGSTHSTITIGWAPPPPEVLPYIQYFELISTETNSNSTPEEAIHPQNSRNLPYMFDRLKTATEYDFKVRACSELTRQCGGWSEVVTSNTMDGASSEPLNLKIQCSHFNISGRNAVSLSWDKPETPNGVVSSYHVVLDGIALFRSDKGVYRNETWGPKVKRVEGAQKAIYEGVPPNTNYTVQVSGITRNKRHGVAASASCTMPPTIPDSMGRIWWAKVKTETGSWVFKLYMPRISERNGPICCYRVYLVRVGEKQRLPKPGDLDIMTYHEVHAPNNTKGGAYIAEILSTANFQSEVFLGDGHRIRDVQNNGSANADEANDSCRKCLNGYIWRAPKKVTTTAPPTTTTTTSVPVAIPELNVAPEISQKEKSALSANLTLEASKILHSKSRRRRQYQNNSIPIEESSKSTLPTQAIQIGNNMFEVFDGPLDASSNYTCFVEVIIKNDNNNGENTVLSAYSEYLQVMTANAPPEEGYYPDNLPAILNIVVQVLCALILLVLVLLLCLCFLRRYYTKNANQGDEVISLRDSLSRALCGGRSGHNHRHLIGSTTAKPPDIGPISKTELPQAYVARHKDTDYGFLREYELLPNRFNDRTTKNSDAKENVYKNRYPDIKAYDQTRVKLAAINCTQGSDYINANFVLGYKERKKFICAQGPMDSTVNDFWRMIWEQHLEIIVMLTNLEEYNKAKCAKYWPEKIQDSTHFGDITVTFTSDTRYSDFLVRELRVARRSGGGNGGGGGSNSEEEEEERHITQYHYLVWKDFMAPEHPHGIIKFIRQINSVYSLQRGPILVHCSAGVGRTGTLVALDSLMQQLDDEGQVSIFNTVCDMRHQRNFLVQSLKQYIFLYRALLDLAQFGNTELMAKGLSATVDNLKQRPNDSKEQCKLEVDFEKIKAITDDINKSCSVGTAEENICKNRGEFVIPFDKNRVILTPIPGREHSTYINASFIEGYDNSESFIITQDPLENTIPDFWRMISEQGINTLVMLSEIGDGPRKCPRYWADDEIKYDHILVKYMHSESCPYYTRREFNVTNCKIDDTIKVTQFQYNGWPTVEGEMPEVTRGMIEIVDQAQKHHNNQDNFSQPGPIAVHCSLGTDRSSLFISMCILVQQLRTEKKVDICTATRKLRSQRNCLIDTYAQFEFLHRAIVNYADLHRLSLDSPSDSS